MVAVGSLLVLKTLRNQKKILSPLTTQTLKEVFSSTYILIV